MTLKELKRLAKRLVRDNSDLKHCHALDMVAKLNGYQDYNAFLKKQ